MLTTLKAIRFITILFAIIVCYVGIAKMVPDEKTVSVVEEKENEGSVS